jgi:aspartate aminotransferase
MKKIQSQSTSNPTSIAQVAAQAALEGQQECVQDMVKVFKQRHDYMVKALNEIDGVECLAGDGTFYVFPDFSGMQTKLNCETDTDLAEKLLEAGVALVPGSAFGTPGHMRISFATSDENLQKAVKRLKNAY